MSNNTILFALYRLGYKGRMTGHGFRGLASTILHENDFADEHIELQLAHLKRNKVAAAYNHAKYLKSASIDDAVVGRLFGRSVSQGPGKPGRHKRGNELRFTHRLLA